MLRHSGVVFATVMGAIADFLSRPIPQPLDYHRFADTRTFFGIPNAFDVLSNVGFLIVGAAGITVVLRTKFRDPVERWSYLLLFIGVTLTAFGSSYYHLAPDNDRLVWDRLPMAVGFMGLLTATLAARVSTTAARALLVPLLAIGCGSVLYWHWTELHGAGDLRPYVLVQFGSLIVIVLLLVLAPRRSRGTAWLVAGLAAYVAAKGFESADLAIFHVLRVVSGHTLKHVSAALGVGCVMVMLRRHGDS